MYVRIYTPEKKKGHSSGAKKRAQLRKPVLCSYLKKPELRPEEDSKVHVFHIFVGYCGGNKMGIYTLGQQRTQLEPWSSQMTINCSAQYPYSQKKASELKSLGLSSIQDAGEIGARTWMVGKPK